MGENIASTIGTHPNDRDCDNYVYVVGNTNPSGHGMNGNVFSSNGLSPTITTNKGEGPRILELLKYGNKRVQSLVDSGKISGDKIEFIDAYNQKVSEICGTIKTTVYSSSMSFITELFSIEPKCVGYTRNSKGKVVKRHLTDIANTIHGSTGSGENTDCFVYNNFRIRKLTPRECFRLMGVSDEDIDKIQAAGISKTQQYKMAGNSIVVDVLYHIFRKMFINKKDENQQLSLF